MSNKVKSTVLLFSVCLAVVHLCFGQSFTTPRVDVAVTVLDEQGIPIADAEVRGLYKGVRAAIDDTVDKKTTPSNGVVQLSGKSFWPVSVTVRKEGYYDSEKDVKTFERINKKNVYSDQETTLVLCKVKNPAAMYAYKFDETLAAVSEPRGYDLIEKDWVAPWGKGVVSDFIFEVTGFFNSYRDNDSVLSLSFANESDGIQTFIPNEQSDFQSPYEAPADGYNSQKSWRKMKQVTLDPSGKTLNRDVNVVDDTVKNSGYLFRIRSVLDENGDISSALYGKIYGRINFAGASKDGTFIRDFQIYLNPTPNDRNLEFDPTQNLFTDLTPRERVKDP